MKITTTLIAFVFCASFLSAQNTYDIQFDVTSIDCANMQVCYDVQLKSSNGVTWGLAGQNYRIFYNSDKASYVSGTSTLPASYQDFTLVQDVQGADASGTGNLPFESSLGFLNYTMDLNDTENGGIFLPGSGDWVTTNNLCFTVSQNVIDEPATCLEMVWGREELTSEYATAYVEVSEWESANMTTAAEPDVHFDLDSNSGDQACFDETCATPKEIEIADVSVLETDGTAEVDVCLDSPATTPLSVDVASSDGTATVNQDYSEVVNTINFAVGETCQTVTVSIINDALLEGPETINLNLSNVIGNANISDGLGVVTIIDDEQPCEALAPTISGN